MYRYGALVVTAPIAVVLLLLRRRYGREPAPAPTPSLATDPPPPPPRSDALRLRTAVHETGHALVAWCCTGVREISKLTIDVNVDLNAEGHVAYSMLYLTDAATALDWCEMAISLGGIAAEVTVYRKVRTLQAAADLQKALHRARLLATAGATKPPWSWSAPARALPFGAMFDPAPSPTEVEILRQAYHAAILIIAAHGDRFHAIVDRALAKRTLDETDLESILGSRMMHRALRVLEPTFIVNLPSSPPAIRPAQTCPSPPSPGSE
jgi:ATP-dependent Zn protease